MTKLARQGQKCSSEPGGTEEFRGCTSITQHASSFGRAPMKIRASCLEGSKRNELIKAATPMSPTSIRIPTAYKVRSECARGSGATTSIPDLCRPARNSVNPDNATQPTEARDVHEAAVSYMNPHQCLTAKAKQRREQNHGVTRKQAVRNKSWSLPPVERGNPHPLDYPPRRHSAYQAFSWTPLRESTAVAGPSCRHTPSERATLPLGYPYR